MLDVIAGRAVAVGVVTSGCSGGVGLVKARVDSEGTCDGIKLLAIVDGLGVVTDNDDDDDDAATCSCCSIAANTAAATC